MLTHLPHQVLICSDEGSIGPFEANAIVSELSGDLPPRPMTHDLLRAVIAALGYQVALVQVTRLEARTFFALLHLEGAGGRLELDCRPSDALALAVRTGAPIEVAEAVLREAQYVAREAEEGEVDAEAEEAEEGEADAEAEEADPEEMERFRDILGGLADAEETDLDAPDGDAER